METKLTAGSTRWRHMFCDNEPQHVQEFRSDLQGGYGPAAGDRCEGCGRPTDLRDWVQVLEAMKESDCRNCRRPIHYVAGVGWLHGELPQYAHQPITCEHAHPVECSHRIHAPCPLDPSKP